MRYVVLVSHGELANGLKNAAFMLAGYKEEVLSTGLLDGLSADEFALVFESTIADINEDDEIILLADIIGGSPLTTALNVLASKGLLLKTKIIGGMNLPLAINVILLKDNVQFDAIVPMVLTEAIEGVKEFTFEDDEEEDL